VTLDVVTRARSSRSAIIAIAVLHVIVAGALLWWSWRKWPDPLVDFGRELYVPWQITQGKVLYRDIASLFGPLSPYLNAVWFSIFGVSLTTLVVCNFTILMAMTAGIHRLLATSTDRATATVATLTVLLLCGFSQYIDVGNYNFITPYAHEATHSVALSVLAFVALQEGLSGPRPGWFAVAGLSVGAVVLTKPEVAIASGAALGAAVLTMRKGAGLSGKRFRRGMASLVAGSLVIPLAFLAYFHTTGDMAWRASGRAIAAGWVTASSAEIAQNEFYLRGSGLDDLVHNAGRMLWSSVLFGCFVAGGLALSSVRPRQTLGRVLRAAGQVALLAVATLAIPSGRFGWALPIIALAVCGWMIARVRAAMRSDALAAQIPLLMWSVFAIALLPKIALNARIYHYGFFLAMPAVSVSVALLLGLAPRTLTWDETARNRARAFFAAAIAIAIVPALVLSNTWYRGKTIAIGNGGDRFYASSDPALWQGPSLHAALAWLSRNAQPDATMIALPEGVMINYLARRQNPTRFINFMPPEAVAFREHAMARALDARSPDLLLLVHKNTTEYGYASFGSTPEYGGEILPWVRRHYRTAEVIGQNPADADGYGIEILKRMDVTPD
jgi:hypothetical protein